MKLPTVQLPPFSRYFIHKNTLYYGKRHGLSGASGNYTLSPSGGCVWEWKIDFKSTSRCLRVRTRTSVLPGRSVERRTLMNYLTKLQVQQKKGEIDE
jgi:hypothetical protein